MLGLRPAPHSRGEPLAFIMEMPLYHRPHLRNIALLVWQPPSPFLAARAGTIILAWHRLRCGCWPGLPSGEHRTRAVIVYQAARLF